MPDTRLTSQEWLFAGFDALVKQGPQALKAEAMARHLGTTKGSFYWHFKDITAFREEMVDLWAEQAASVFTQHLSTGVTPTLQLRTLGQPPAPTTPLGTVKTETAMRGWAQADHKVADVIAKIDIQRTTYLADLLRQLDVTDPSFATLVYGAWVGMHMQNQAEISQPMETLIDLILALR
jgi:AcrR family transcriptional regulator